MNNPRRGTREAEAKLAEAAPLRELADEVRAYPLRLLRAVIQQYALRHAPVPDHSLRLPPYLGETALRGLVEGGMVERVEDAARSIHAYIPTEAGLALIALADGAGPTTPAKRQRANGTSGRALGPS